MKIALLLLLAATATSAAAADAPPTTTPLTIKALDTPAAPKPAASVRRMSAPSLSETRVTRAADGSLRLDCKQKPNPKVLQQRADVRAKQAAQP